MGVLLSRSSQGSGLSTWESDTMLKEGRTRWHVKMGGRGALNSTGLFLRNNEEPLLLNKCPYYGDLILRPSTATKFKL